LLDDNQPVAAQFVGPAVRPLRQPALDDPGAAMGRERVRVPPRDASGADDVHARAQVHEHRVVADGPRPEPEPEQRKRRDEERFEARRSETANRRRHYLKFLEMLMTAGPMTTTNKAGKIQ